MTRNTPTVSPFFDPPRNFSSCNQQSDLKMPRDTQMVKQACDACRRRKVKCNAQRPCSQCRSAGLSCRTSLVRQKKGRQGQSANVLSELRTQNAQGNEQSNPTIASLTVATPLVNPTSGRCRFVRKENVLPRELIRDCSEYFFARMQGTVPILQAETFRRYVEQMDHYIHAYCLVVSFCAFVMMQTGYSSSQAAGSRWTQSMDAGRELLDEATEARRHLDPLTVPVRQSITIAFLLYGCHIALGNQRHAYYFLREATTLYTAGMLDTQSGALDGDEDNSSSGKLFWLLLISERYFAPYSCRRIVLIQPEPTPSADIGPSPYRSPPTVQLWKILHLKTHPLLDSAVWPTSIAHLTSRSLDSGTVRMPHAPASRSFFSTNISVMQSLPISSFRISQWRTSVSRSSGCEP